MSKTKTVSMRLTEKENEMIKSRASEKGLSLSRYMVNCATAKGGFTTNDKQKIYYHKAIIQDYVKQLTEKCEDPVVQLIKGEVEKLCQLLK